MATKINKKFNTTQKGQMAQRNGKNVQQQNIRKGQGQAQSNVKGNVYNRRDER